MDIKGLIQKAKKGVSKYKYAAIILLVGLLLLLLPGKSDSKTQAVTGTPVVTQTFEKETLELILQSIEGAGKVRVLLSTASGPETVYQINSDVASDGGSVKKETVIVTDSQRNEAGLIRQVNPPKFMGAIVVCEGADSPTVKFAVTQAVAKITGLGTDSICVLKMK